MLQDLSIDMWKGHDRKFYGLEGVTQMSNFVGCAFMPHPPIMIREVGGADSENISKSIAAASQAARFLMQQNPETLVVITPHAPGFRDAAGVNVSPRVKGNLGSFGHPEVSVAYDTDVPLAQQILRQSERLGVGLMPLDDAAALKYRISLNLDHGAVVPLTFLQKEGFQGRLVHLSVGWLPYEEMYSFGKVVQMAIDVEGRKTCAVISGDLSHRLLPDAPAGYSPLAADFDRRVVEALGAVDTKALLALEPELVEAAGECGLRPAFFCMGLLDGLEAQAEVLSYEGPFGVGYAVATFTPTKK